MPPVTGDSILYRPAMIESLLVGLERSGLAASDDPMDLAQAVGLGIRAAHLLGYEIIKQVADEFPASIQGMMDFSDPQIDVARDAFTQAYDFVGFVEMLDIISQEESECVAPHLHRGS